MDITVSTKKAAGILNVNESSIKRWADNGYLKCFKTPGGHRKFRLEDLKDLATDYNLNTSIITPLDKNSKLKVYVSQRNFEKLTALFEQYILAGDVERSYSLVYTLFMNKFTLPEIFDKVINKTMTRIGTKWKNKILGIDKEHIASNTVMSVLHQFEKYIENNNDDYDSIAICAGLEDELHEIGLLCVKLTLKHSGFKVIYPGINLPVKSLKLLLEEYKPSVLCISATYSCVDTNLKKNLDKIKKLCNESNTLFFLGGETAGRVKDNKIICCQGIEDLLKGLAEKNG